MTAERMAMVGLSVIPHADGEYVSVVVAVGGSLTIETVKAEDAPRPPSPDDCLGCGGAGETALWIHGEPEPESVDVCSMCGGTGKRRAA